jgi:nucleoprotein TPR
MATAAVDVGYLAASYSVPEPTIQSLLSAPTVELVQSFLAQIEAKAREFDELKSEKLRSDVELENAIRGSDTLARSLKASADKALKEAEELRQKLSQEGKCAHAWIGPACNADSIPSAETAREQIETELQTLKSTATNSSSEVQSLESRIKTLESQNRDTVALHEAKSAAHDRLAEELSTQHQKFVALRKQVSELEEKCQTLENAATSVRFREQNFQQEIELLKKNNDWYETELKTRATDNTKFRKEKNAQIAELQRANADASQTIETLRRTEASQHQNLQLLEQQLEDKISSMEQLQNQAALSQESFRAELDNARRLATLHQESANTAKAHLQEVKDLLDQVEDRAAAEVGQLQAEVQTERIEREKLETNTAELEKKVETLEAIVSESRTLANVPATPRRGMNGAFDTPGRAGSPSVMTPGGSRIRGGLSTTQLYAENTQLKAELRTYQERDEKRTATMNEMLEELENRQPEIEELRQENERLTTETGEISALLEESIAERELARKELRKSQGDHQGLQRQCEIQSQQLRDLSQQINILLYQQQVQEQGLESLNSEQQQKLLAVIHGVPDDELEDTTATGRLISKHLILFRDVEGLKKQNDELMRTIRSVGDQYEGSEAREKSNQAEKDRIELAQLREKLSRNEEEIKSLNLRSQSYMKERDMFRRIVTSRGQLPAGSDGATPSTPPPGNFSESVNQTPGSKELTQYDRLIKDMQAHMDALKHESATDHATLKRQVDDLAKENNRLQSNVMQLNNANQLSRERYELLQNKLKLLQSENDEIQKKCDSLQDAAAKQDVRTQQAAEELVEAKSLADSLERENTNLKQSQGLSKTIETRLADDNKALVEERGRLNKMISDLQNLRNEQDLSEAENRRRLQSRADSLETELQNVQRKLDEEVEDHKKAIMRREYEQTETRRQLDDLTKALHSIRPELASVKTERDQLQGRVDELKVELRAAEERGQNMHSRVTQNMNGSTEANEDGLSREEELTIEVSNLKQELETALEQVEAAKTHIETYKTIAQDAEEQLDNLHKTSDQMQQETDRVMAEKDAKILDLEQRVEEISTELATTNTELSELRRTHEEENLRLVQQKEFLETEVTRIKDEAEGYKNTAAFHEEDKKVQAEIATRAQQNYEHEVGKHGETMNNLRDIREEHNKLRTTVAQYKAEGEAALASLTQGEAHWAETRERYEREIAEGRTRYNDLNEQNKILHQQLENVSTQISGLKTSRVSIAGGDSDAANADADAGGLQEIVQFLRREKEIVEIQHEMSLQEAKRLKLQLDNTQSQLDEVREKLSMEQQSRTQTKQNASSLKTLQDTVEQLNVYRESSSSLRNEARQAQDRLKEKTDEVEKLYSQIQPLQARVHEIEGELSIKNGELELLQRDRDHWQKRHQDVLQKYDRIDPVELEALKTQIETLRVERDQAQELVNGVEERINSEKSELEKGFQERREKLINSSKEKVRSMNQTIKERDATIQAVTTERDELRQQLTSVQQELEATKAARDEAIANANTDTAMDEEGQIDENSGLSNAEREALEARAIAAERAHMEESNRSVAVGIENQFKTSRIKDLENQIVSLTKCGMLRS